MAERHHSRVNASVLWDVIYRLLVTTPESQGLHRLLTGTTTTARRSEFTVEYRCVLGKCERKIQTIALDGDISAIVASPTSWDVVESQFCWREGTQKLAPNFASVTCVGW
ncbi:hypothetical protein [Acaryochloris sp. CCMEE 5410]|uniref:hypothetical protein n=1 Tax=Acaryochloris sp. CCMEE 5410 TaxID=310037 RepID=UPI00024852FF|nr:hypothetical protein [Acaryochloris sp. CCMEE 5410]KAI9133732.1 hypothetical protein ON05_010800 [Acaryochloris sp. CCMEE 5410]